MATSRPGCRRKSSAAGSATIPHSDSTTKCHAKCCGRFAPSTATIGQKLSVIAARRSGANVLAASDRTPAKQVLIEPLSERELEVLRLLGTGLNGPEIARALIVSLNTIRTHTKNIYSKLGVNDRRAAVRRAEELDVF